MSCGDTSTQSVIEKVPCSENDPLSKFRMKWQGLSPIVWIEWPWPFGKNQMSPGL